MPLHCLVQPAWVRHRPLLPQVVVTGAAMYPLEAISGEPQPTSSPFQAGGWAISGTI